MVALKVGKPVTITHSSKAAFLDCPHKYYLSYERLLSPVTLSTNLVIGDVVHRGLAAILSDKTTIETVISDVIGPALDAVRSAHFDDPEEFEAHATAVDAMIVGWSEHRGFLKDLRAARVGERQMIEIPFDVSIPGTAARLLGKMDAIVSLKDGYWIVEHKTAGQLGEGYIKRLAVDDQVTNYFYAASQILPSKPVGVIYNVLRKPSARPTKKETLSQYLNRMVEDYKARPDFYYYQTKLYRDSDSVKRLCNSLKYVVEDIQRSRDRSFWVRNTSNCTRMGTCSFLPICTGGELPEVMARYVVREERHPELKSDSAD